MSVVTEQDAPTEAIPQPPEHVASADCWCCPTIEYLDPETGAAVYVHRELQ